MDESGVSPSAAEGCFVALNRDEARRLFGLQDDAGVWALMEELRGAEPVTREQRLLHCPAWESLHGVLRGGAFSPEGEDYPLNHAVLEGRPMTQDPQRGYVLLKRPDTVNHVAEALGQVNEEQLRCVSAEAAAALPALRDFYQRAAHSKCAVVFVVENKV